MLDVKNNEKNLEILISKGINFGDTNNFFNSKNHYKENKKFHNLVHFY